MTKSKVSSLTPRNLTARPTRTTNDVVLAVDPGFDRLGVAILSRGKTKEKLLFSTCITTNPKMNHAERLLEIGGGVQKIISKWSPDSLAVETLFFNQNISSAIGVAEARGVVLYQAVKNGLRIYEYSPQAIKLAVTGYGRATKSQIKSLLPRLIEIASSKTPRLDDELDAIALGLTHHASTRGNYPHK